jgi:hypothetical protein
MHTIMHLLPSVAKQPNLELKTRPKQLLVSLPLVIALPGQGILKGGSITVPLTSCWTGSELAVGQLTIFVFICKTD